MGLNIRENRGKLYLDIWHNGRRKREYLELIVSADKTQRDEINTLSKLLGHTDVKTTQVYANATDKMKREAVNALPVIDIARGE